MIGGRFFTKSREIFGTPLLQMSSQNIKRLCKTNKFHLSTRVNIKKSEELNNAFDKITKTIRCSDKTNLTEVDEGEVSDRTVVDELLKVSIAEMACRSISKIMLQDLKTIEVRLCGPETLSAALAQSN